MSSTSKQSGGPIANVQEFKIRVPKNSKKRHHVMRFNANLNVDFTKWRNVRLERENNMREYRGLDEEMPKFGAGSEFNRDLREEVRRKKFGIISKRYRPEAQPWILKVGGKNGKKFKGIREGGVSENASFYVFTHAPDGAIEAYPLHEWYKFQPIQRYKSLSAEEAEQEFGRRKKVMNYFSLMLRKRLKGDEDDEDPEEVKAKGSSGGGKAKELKISEMDEWIDSEDESDSESDEETKKKKKDEDDDDIKKKPNKGLEKKKKKRDVDDEAFEESDDGDEEGREMDYDTESSDSELDLESKLDKDMKSVAEEDALRNLLTSEEEDEEEKKSDESENEDDDKKKKNKDETNKDKKKTKKASKDDKKDSSSDFSSDSPDSEDENPIKKKPKDGLKSNANSSRSTTPTTFIETNKRKGSSMPSDLTASENSNSPATTPAKRMKSDMSSSLPSTFAGVVNAGSKDDFGITEEAVRRYLMRKPMTATELLTKFKNKKSGVTSDRLVETMTLILKRINPVKQTIQGKMYLSIKVNK